ncbi:hypothetical protein ACIBF5_09885 [Micromonospora sp. NPDC050417]|uniref:hypothetical protein n=1 Tax=Micromonospora sp. NPDC050417 TaxID=3364280 RepID=UPI0037B04C3E
MSGFPSTVAVERTCRCGRTVLVGQDEGIPVRAERTAQGLDAAGLAYVIDGRGYLTWRNPDHPPAGPIHPAHHCTGPRKAEPPLTLF